MKLLQHLLTIPLESKNDFDKLVRLVYLTGNLCDDDSDLHNEMVYKLEQYIVNIPEYNGYDLEHVIWILSGHTDPICDVTGKNLYTTPCEEPTLVGGWLTLNDCYDSDFDMFNTDNGIEHLTISVPILYRTLQYWKTLPEFNCSNTLTELYKHVERATTTTIPI